MRDALLTRAAFYLLWHGGLRLGEAEDPLLEDIDFPGRRITVRNCKGLKDRTIYLTRATTGALQDYLASRREGFSEHVFLFRNAALKKDILRAQLQYAGQRVGVHVYPHRLRHTCATQLLNAGCRITSIQRFLGHKKLNTTMIYARAHDQSVAEDYFSAMARVEQRVGIVPEPKPELNTEIPYEVVNVQERKQPLVWVDLLSLPELPQADRLSITAEMRRELLQNVSPPFQVPIQAVMQVFEEASP